MRANRTVSTYISGDIADMVDRLKAWHGSDSRAVSVCLERYYLITASIVPALTDDEFGALRDWWAERDGSPATIALLPSLLGSSSSEILRSVGESLEGASMCELVALVHHLEVS